MLQKLVSVIKSLFVFQAKNLLEGKKDKKWSEQVWMHIVGTIKVYFVFSNVQIGMDDSKCISLLFAQLKKKKDLK